MAQTYVPFKSGNDMTIESTKLIDAIFQSNWIHLSKPFKKDMIFFMMKLQKPLTITVGYIFNLDFITFTKVNNKN